MIALCSWDRIKLIILNKWKNWVVKKPQLAFELLTRIIVKNHFDLEKNFVQEMAKNTPPGSLNENQIKKFAIICKNLNLVDELVNIMDSTLNAVPTTGIYNIF